MWTWLASLLTGPMISAALEAWKVKVAAANTQDAHAVEVVQATLMAEIEARKQAAAIIIAEQGRWYTALPRTVIQWSYAIFVAKCVVYDTVLGLGTTPKLGGDIAVWGGLVMTMWFGGHTALAIARTVWRK